MRMFAVKTGVSILLTISIGCPVTAQQSPIAQTRNTLEEWVQVEKTISAEREDWIAEKSTTEDLIGLLRSEIATLKAKQAEAEALTTRAEERRRELIAQREAARAATDVMLERVSLYEDSIRKLLPRLPLPLMNRIESLANRIPKAGASTELGIGRRMQTVIGILSEIDKFNQEVTLVTEVQALPDGRSVEVESVYLGLGGGYFTDPTGKYAGQLLPDEDGWVAVVEPEHAAAIRQIILQYNGLEPADYITLPAQLR